jgi:hypothetical protein
MYTGIFQLKNEISGGAFHDSNERYPPPKCHPDTRAAVLKSILRWVESSTEGKSVLWLYGPAGAGKSAITQTVAERTESGDLAASFFFSRSKPDRDTAQKLWATIAFQIAVSLPTLRHVIGSAVVDTPSIFFKSPQSQLQKLIIEPFRSLGSQTADISQRSPFLVIIDGLDECKHETEQSEVLRSVMGIISSHRLPLRFLIASRPEPHIRRSFDGRDLTDISFRICLDESFDPTNDIQAFLCHEFGVIYEKHLDTMASIPRPWPSDDVVRQLAARSSGQFIYAATVIRFIDDEDYRPTDRLELVLNTSRSTAFKDLDLLYQQILSKSSDVSLLLRILGCILVLRQPMSASDIESLMCLRQGDVRLTLRRLHSLVHVPDLLGSKIVPYHASLGDFIFNSDRSGDFYVSQQACHLDVARCCLRFAKHHSGRTHKDRCVCCCHNLVAIFEYNSNFVEFKLALRSYGAT